MSTHLHRGRRDVNRLRYCWSIVRMSPWLKRILPFRLCAPFCLDLDRARSLRKPTMNGSRDSRTTAAALSTFKPYAQKTARLTMVSGATARWLEREARPDSKDPDRIAPLQRRMNQELKIRGDRQSRGRVPAVVDLCGVLVQNLCLAPPRGVKCPTQQSVSRLLRLGETSGGEESGGRGRNIPGSRWPTHVADGQVRREQLRRR